MTVKNFFVLFVSAFFLILPIKYVQATTADDPPITPKVPEVNPAPKITSIVIKPKPSVQTNTVVVESPTQKETTAKK